MEEQLEFPFIESAKRRDQLLTDVDFSQYRNRSLMASILLEIARFKPGEFYRSQVNLSKLFKVSVKTIQRAFETLRRLDLIVTQKRSRPLPNGGVVSVNHYWINWTELERSVDAQKARALGQPGVLTLSKSIRTVRADQCDTSPRPLGQLDPTIRTVSCPTIDLTLERSTTTKPVVVGDNFQDERPETRIAKPEPSDSANPLLTVTESAFDTFQEVRDLLSHFKPVGVAKCVEAVEAASNRGWTPDYCKRLIEYATTNEKPASHLCTWFLSGTPPEEFAIRELKRMNSTASKTNGKDSKLDFHKHRLERLQNIKQAANEPTMLQMLRELEASV